MKKIKPDKDIKLGKDVKLCKSVKSGKDAKLCKSVKSDKYVKLCKDDWFSAMLCIGAIVPGVLVYQRLPDMMATNFGIDGRPEQYSSKPFVVFGIPLVMAAMQLLLCVITNYFCGQEKRDKVNKVVRYITPAVLYMAQTSILLYALGKMTDIGSVVCTFCSILFIVSGNYLPKIRRNMLIGIRTPHTLSSQEVWDKTHRFSGIIFIICGMIMLPYSMTSHYISVGVIIAGTLIFIFICSEVIYYEEQRKTAKSKKMSKRID